MLGRCRPATSFRSVGNGLLTLLRESCMHDHMLCGYMQRSKFPPEATVYDSKRLLGQTFGEVSPLVEDWPFRVAPVECLNKTPEYQGTLAGLLAAYCVWDASCVWQPTALAHILHCQRI